MDKLSQAIHDTLYPKSMSIGGKVVKYALTADICLTDTLDLDLAMIVANNTNMDFVALANYDLWLVNFEEDDDEPSQESRS